MTTYHDPPQLTIADVNAWSTWLKKNDSSSSGVWVTLAKKGTRTPTSLTYAEALDEALCSGWIDGRRNAIDSDTFREYFTPRRQRSLWSQRNVELVTELIDAGRMRAQGFAEIARAQADGRWERAYPGAALLAIPADFLAALRAAAGEAAFGALPGAARYAVLLDIVTAGNEPLRAVRIARHAKRVAAAVSSANRAGKIRTTEDL